MLTANVCAFERPNGYARSSRESVEKDASAPRRDAATPIVVREHELLFADGDPASRRYEIVDGAVMLYKVLADGRRQLVELLGPGDMFGLTCGPEYDCSAETLVSTRLRVHRRLDCSQVPEAVCQMCKRLQEKVRDLHDHAVVLGRKSAMEKVAGFLIRLSGSNPGRADAHVRMSMTRQEMADYLGLTIETVSRTLSELRRRGLVVFDKADWFHIADFESMRRLSGDA